MTTKELQPKFTKKVIDFYGNDLIVTKDDGTEFLIDTGVPILRIKEKEAEILVNHPTDWEMTAIKEFMAQRGFVVSTLRIWQMKAKWKKEAAM